MAISNLDQCQVLKRHDDGDMTLQCPDGRYVLTTEGETFKQQTEFQFRPFLLAVVGSFIGGLLLLAIQSYLKSKSQG